MHRQYALIGLVACSILASCGTAPAPQVANTDITEDAVVSYNPPKYYDEYAVSPDIIAAQSEYKAKLNTSDANEYTGYPCSYIIQHPDYKEVIAYSINEEESEEKFILYVTLTENSRFKRWQEALQCNVYLPTNNIFYTDIALGNDEYAGAIFIDDVSLTQFDSAHSSEDKESFVRWALAPFACKNIKETRNNFPFNLSLSDADLFYNMYKGLMDDYIVSNEYNSLDTYTSNDNTFKVQYINGYLHLSKEDYIDDSAAISDEFNDDYLDGDYGCNFNKILFTNTSSSSISLSNILLTLYRDIPLEADSDNWDSPLDFDNTVEMEHLVYCYRDNKFTDARDLVIQPGEEVLLIVVTRVDREGIYRTCFKGLKQGQFMWTFGKAKNFMGTSVSDYILPETNCGALSDYNGSVNSALDNVSVIDKVD